MGIICALVGGFFAWMGIKNYKNAEKRSEANPRYSAETWKLSGAICAIAGIFMIGCGIFIISLESQTSSIPHSSSTSDHKCAICGKSGGRQITNQAGDNNYYCTEHYADAWQYYYGD